jgi:ribonucrease Y
LTAEQAKELLLRAMENEARYEGAKLIKRIESEAKEEADKKAKKFWPPPFNAMPPIMSPNAP